jgi:hypothetical protein
VAGVEHHGHLTGAGMRARDAAVTGDHQTQPDQTQIRPFLLALPRCAIGTLALPVSM